MSLRGRSRALTALLALAAAGMFGCVQQAILLPVARPILTNIASVSRPTPFTAVDGDAAQAGGGDSESRAGERFAIHSADSKLEVRGGDLITGMHEMRFSRWRGAFFARPGAPLDRLSGYLTLEIDLGSLDTDAVVDDSLRNHLLEVDKHPVARFAGSIRPRADQVEGHVFQGRLLLHGIERAIRFYVTVRTTGGDYRIESVFDLSRAAFDMHRRDLIEITIYDNFRVVLDLLAHGEQVSAEVLPP